MQPLTTTQPSTDANSAAEHSRGVLADPQSLGRPTLQLVQIFRGIAAVLVMLYHVTTTNHFYDGYMWEVFGFGHSGVDFFFVLSGFVMLYAHYDQGGQARRTFRFLGLRAVRIYPIYWCVLAVTVLMFWLHPPRPENQWAPDYTLEPDVLLSAVLLRDPGRTIVLVAWTLTFELVFYGFFSLFFLLGARVFAFLSLLWCTALAAQWSGIWYQPYPILLRPIVGEFFLGCLAAFLVKRLDWKRVSVWWVIAAIAVYVALARAEILGVVDGYTWWAIPCFLVIWMGAAYDHASRRTYPRALVLLGEASYSLYLIHYGSIAIFAETVDYYRATASIAPQVTLTVLALVITLAGIVVHVVIERPLLAVARGWLR